MLAYGHQYQSTSDSLVAFAMYHSSPLLQLQPDMTDFSNRTKNRVFCIISFIHFIHLIQVAMKRYQLAEKAGADPQTYGLGIKEVWEVPQEVHKPGTVVHTVRLVRYN